jgi:hypothetical protein
LNRWEDFGKLLYYPRPEFVWTSGYARNHTRCLYSKIESGHVVSFYAEPKAYAIGYWEDEDGPFQHYGAVITVPLPEGDQKLPGTGDNNRMSTQLALIRPESQRAPDEQGAPRQRLFLYPGELYRVPANYRQLRVVAGAALVTQAARDLILGTGHTAALESGRDVALVSALYNQNLILELY